MTVAPTPSTSTSPPTYAILGATGNTGSSIVQILLQQHPNSRIHAYCRNAKKLHTLVPATASNDRVRVFEGNVQDPKLMADCIKGCKAVFMVATMNENMPGCRIARDATSSLLTALKELKLDASSGSTKKPPKIIVLSSSSLEEYLSANVPTWFHQLMLRSASYIYADLREQERMLRAEAAWLPVVYIKPGGLSLDVQRGHKLDLELQDTFISYLDLAAAMLEVADDGEGRYDGRNVSIHNTNGSAKAPGFLPLLALVGVLRHYFPWLHPYLPMGGV